MSCPARDTLENGGDQQSARTRAALVVAVLTSIQDAGDWPVDDLRAIQATSARRCARWHHEDTVPWTGADWSNAMCGEAGEAANVVKKLRRLETNTVGGHNAADTDELALRAKLGEELADTILYAVLVADHYGIDLATSVVAKFNRVSVESDFPERIG